MLNQLLVSAGPAAAVMSVIAFIVRLGCGKKADRHVGLWLQGCVTVFVVAALFASDTTKPLKVGDAMPQVGNIAAAGIDDGGQEKDKGREGKYIGHAPLLGELDLLFPGRTDGRWVTDEQASPGLFITSHPSSLGRLR